MTQSLRSVLVVDDDEEIRDLLARYLSGQGFDVRVAPDRRQLLAALEIGGVDLVVLDVMLPDGSGIEICRDLRGQGSMVPIILLTALKEDVDRIVGLEVGADDYLGKPFNPRELAARIRAVLRRQTIGLQRDSLDRGVPFRGLYDRTCAAARPHGRRRGNRVHRGRIRSSSRVGGTSQDAFSRASNCWIFAGRQPTRSTARSTCS